MKPHYDYYVETDLDTIDDQPIDYSKRYNDQLADDVCGASSGKKRHMSSPSAVPNKIPGDELKVYCIEGTPLIISSASSLCDLYELGSLTHAPENAPLKQNVRDKPGFEELYSDNSRDNDTVKYNEVLQSEGFEQDQVDNKEESVEVENASQPEENFSKASSPLMFSRSSSIGSLNSFEQNSIVDDRSSVSMFSNLASGIISPSEIPDSPGEAMSPFVPKRQSQFVFPPNDNLKSMDPILAKLKLDSDLPFADEEFGDVVEDNLKVFNDEGDCCSVSNLSALSLQTGSMSHVSVAVFHKDSVLDLKRKSTIRISCSMVTGNAELQSVGEDVNVDKKHVMLGLSPKENCVESNKSCLKDFPNYPVSDAVDDEDEKINYSSLNNEDDDCKDDDGSPGEDFDDDYEHLNSFENPIKEKAFIPENESPDDSKDISDEEGDELLAECIRNGMQESSSHHQNSKSPLSDSFQSNQDSNTKDEFKEQNISDSDCDTSDSEEDNELLQSCIQLGMPQKSPIPLNKDVQQSSGNNHQKPPNSPPKSPQNFSKEMDEESDDEEYDPLLQQIIELGKPKKEPTELSKEKLKVANSYPSDGQNLGYRDNCPDGVSDEDEDDDILNECILAGMPKPKPEMNHYQKQCASSAKAPPMKPQPHPQRPLSASQDRENYLSSFAGPHSKYVKSPSREDRTMNQTYKIYQLQQRMKSSIPEDYSMPMPAHSRSHQRQLHGRSLPPDDRAMFLNSHYGQCQPQSHRRSPTSGEQMRSLGTFNSQCQPQSYRRSATTIEQTRSFAMCSGQRQSQTQRRSPTTVEHSRSMATSNGQCQSYRRSLTTVEQMRSVDAVNGLGQSHRRSPMTLEQARSAAALNGQYQSQRRSPNTVEKTRSPNTYNGHCQPSHRSSTTVEQARSLGMYNGQCQPQWYRRSPNAVEQTRSLSTYNGQSHFPHRRSPTTIEQTRPQTRRKSPTTENRSTLLATFNGHCQPQRSSASADRTESSQRRKSPSTPERTRFQPPANTGTSPGSDSKAAIAKKYFNWIHNSIFSRNPNLSPTTMPDDATCTYRTEDTPILSPSASVSDLSVLSFSEDRMFDGFDEVSRHNSLRNSDCSSDSEDDELLQQCIRSGMPTEKRAHA